jgi:hypothetical protein
MGVHRDELDPLEELAQSLSDDDAEQFEQWERAIRLRERPLALHVNAKTGEMFSPSGTISDEAILELERRLRERQAKPPS